MTRLTGPEIDRIEAIAPNFKRRLSGVTSTIIQLVPEQRRLGLSIATLGPGLPGHFPELAMRDCWRLWRLPADRKPRIWHARRNIEMIAGVLARDLLRMPLRLVFTSAAQRKHKPLTKYLIGKMDAVIATSASSGAFLEVPHTVIMHGIDTNRFVPPASKAVAKQAVGLDPDRLVAGCAGRVRPSKGTDLFVDAMIALLPGRPRWDAVITGRATRDNIAFQRGLEARIRQAGLAGRIRFVGEVPDMLPWYQAFDLFVAPSRIEGFGLTPLEAMACGVPCVTSDAGSYAEMIDAGVTGLAVPAGSKAALVNAVAMWTSNSMASPDLVRRRVVTLFALDGEARALNSIYGDVRKH